MTSKPIYISFFQLWSYRRAWYNCEFASSYFSGSSYNLLTGPLELTSKWEKIMQKEGTIKNILLWALVELPSYWAYLVDPVLSTPTLCINFPDSDCLSLWFCQLKSLNQKIKTVNWALRSSPAIPKTIWIIMQQNLTTELSLVSILC